MDGIQALTKFKQFVICVSHHLLTVIFSGQFVDCCAYHFVVIFHLFTIYSRYRVLSDSLSSKSEKYPH